MEFKFKGNKPLSFLRTFLSYSVFSIYFINLSFFSSFIFQCLHAFFLSTLSLPYFLNHFFYLFLSRRILLRSLRRCYEGPPITPYNIDVRGSDVVLKIRGFRCWRAWLMAALHPLPQDTNMVFVCLFVCMFVWVFVCLYVCLFVVPMIMLSYPHCLYSKCISFSWSHRTIHSS